MQLIILVIPNWALGSRRYSPKDSVWRTGQKAGKELGLAAQSRPAMVSLEIRHRTIAHTYPRPLRASRPPMTLGGDMHKGERLSALIWVITSLGVGLEWPWSSQCRSLRLSHSNAVHFSFSLPGKWTAFLSTNPMPHSIVWSRTWFAGVQAGKCWTLSWNLNSVQGNINAKHIPITFTPTQIHTKNNGSLPT